jgi:hypothetical protein
MKLTDASTAAQALAEELGRSFLDLADVTPDDAVLDKVPRSTVKRHSVLPLFIDDDTLLIACVSEPDQELEDELRLRFELPMRPVIATPLAINQGIAKYYAAGLRDESAADEAIKGKSRKKPSKTKVKKKRVRFDKLSPEEQYERKQYGYIIMCWGAVASAFIDQFILKGRLIPWGTRAFFTTFPFDQFFLSLFIPPIVIWWVYRVYWK